MTTRLYYTDAYLSAFDARVVDRADDGRRVYLDRTAFYPTSGGQPHDLGTLGDRRVIDVVDEDDRIAHVLDAPLDTAEVRGAIDWARRFDHMQQHTGQHLLSAVFADLFGHATVSVHFGAESSSLDLDVGTIDRERVLEGEARANEIVAENRGVEVTFEDAASAAGLRKASAREGTLRVVSIAGVDRSACGGTHVRATGEIGVVLLRRVERVKKAARVEFVCGRRAARRARADFEALTAVAQSLSASLDDVPALVAAQGERLRDADAGRRRLEGELAAFHARARWEAVAPDETGVRRIVERRPTGSVEELKGLAHALCALPKTVLVAAVDAPPAILLAASDDAGLDAGRTLRSVLAEVGGRGGGSPRMAQGGVPGRAELERVISALE